MKHGAENKLLRTLTSYGVECLLRLQDMQVAESCVFSCGFSNIMEDNKKYL